jgi:hypothetical protein
MRSNIVAIAPMHLTPRQEISLPHGTGRQSRGWRSPPSRRGRTPAPFQIACALRAEVFTTASPEQFTIVRGYGATPIDYKSTSVEQYVNEFTGGAGYDVIYDTVGGAVLDAPFAAAKTYEGHVVSCLAPAAERPTDQLPLA